MPANDKEITQRSFVAPIFPRRGRTEGEPEDETSDESEIQVHRREKARLVYNPQSGGPSLLAIEDLTANEQASWAADDKKIVDGVRCGSCHAANRQSRWAEVDQAGRG